jgi:glutathione S-transferase/translation elongation factor EF-1beta
MKLHYSTEGATNSRYRKIKSVANALKVNLEEVAHDASSDLSAVSVFNTLPILETPQGSLFSSNSIIRFLAGSNDNQLYGENLHNRALVDQWLDITTCDFEAAVSAVAIAKDGREVDAVKILADINKFLGFVEKHLNGKKFVVGETASLADYSLATGIAVVLAVLGEEERKAYPNITAWYLALVATDAVIGGKDFPKESHKAFKPKQEKKKEEPKKEEAKPEPKKKNSDDLFSEEDETAEKKPAKPKKETKAAPAPAPAKPKKAPAIAKSIVVFDVKVYEEEYDLDALWEKIKKEVIIEGLVWSPDIKKIPVVGKVFKLQLGCVIEDLKVNTDDIFDKITAWEDDVQSIDVVSFQKL